MAENDSGLRLVLVDMMLATAMGTGRPLEVWLTNEGGSTAADQFLRLANGELDRAYRWAGLFLRDGHEAEDATQDALLRAWRAAGSLRDPASFQRWFDRILVNVCRDRLRRRGSVRFVAIEDASGVSVTRDPFKTLLDQDEVFRAMARLDDDSRLALVLHYWADLTLEGVAERCGWPVGTVKSRLHRGLALMKRQLQAAPSVEDVR
jgi:RNA polymerase sigma-70 factor (ECF subfamily)